MSTPATNPPADGTPNAGEPSIPIRPAIEHDPRIEEIARLVGATKAAVIGGMVLAGALASRCGVTRNATEMDRTAQLPGFAEALVRVGWLVEEGGELRLADDTKPTQAEHRRRLGRIRQRRLRARRKAEKEGRPAPPPVTPRNAGGEREGPTRPPSEPRGAGPDADLPPFDPARKRVLAGNDAPHLHEEARLVARHYALAVGSPSMATGPAVVPVMDLLSQGVRAELLLRAADVYGAFLKLSQSPPMGVLNFFGPGDNWKEYAKGPPRRPNSPPPASRDTLSAPWTPAPDNRR